jgi:hypothetical protein
MGASARRAARLTHYFDTFHIVTRLEASGFQHGQAVATMNAIRALLLAETEMCKAEMLSRADLENQSYLFRAAMSELLSEIKILRRNEAMQLRLETLGLQRKLEVLDQQMREDLQTMRTEVEMDVEMRRSQTRSDAKDIELRIQELDNKFTVKLGDLKTAMERYKWDSTRRLLLGLVVIAVIGTYIINRPKKKSGLKEDEGGVETELGLLDNTHARPGNTFVSLG